MEIIRLFSIDLEIRQIAQITKVSRLTINKYLELLRQRIAQYCELESPLKGEIEVD